MRPLIAMLLLLALIVTGSLVAADILQFLGPTRDRLQYQPAAAANDARLIDAFYGGANQIISGADPRALLAVAAPEMLLHEAGSAQHQGIESLTTYFAAMARPVPMRFQVRRVVPDDKGYLVLLDVMADAVPTTSIANPAAIQQWTTTDKLAISKGMVREYWPGAVPLLPLPGMPGLKLDALSNPAVAALARLEIAPGAVMRELNIPARQMIVVEHGAIRLRTPGAVRISRGGGPWREEEVRADTSQTQSPVPELEAGDAALAPAAGLSLSNDQAEPASVLSILITAQQVLNAPKYKLSEAMLVAVGMHDPRRQGESTRWDTGVTSTPLAAIDLPDDMSAMAIAGSSRVVATGERCSECIAAPFGFAVITSGLMDLTSDVSDSSPDNSAQSARLLWAGDAASITPSHSVALANAGPSPLILFIFRLAPEATIATPATS